MTRRYVDVWPPNRGRGRSRGGRSHACKSCREPTLVNIVYRQLQKASRWTHFFPLTDVADEARQSQQPQQTQQLDETNDPQRSTYSIRRSTNNQRDVASPTNVQQRIIIRAEMLNEARCSRPRTTSRSDAKNSQLYMAAVIITVII